jgi:hypothetical protein
MIDPRLLVPLSALPGPVPVGAPLVVEWATGPSPAVLLRDGGGEQVCVAVEIGVGWQSDPPKPPRRLCWLDLSPPDPPLSRVDGLDVGLRMLGIGTGEIAWVERLTGGSMWLHVGPVKHGHDTFWCKSRPVAMADTDPTDPLALRLAVAAILRAGGAR